MPTNKTAACSSCGKPMWKTDLAALPTCRECRRSGIRRSWTKTKRIGCQEPKWPNCWTCGEQMERKHGTRYCSERCQPSAARQGEAKQRRRARIRATSDGSVDRLAVFKRDQWMCHICRQKTDPTKAVPHPNAPTIDHVIPLACGGEHIRANVATAHFSCNSRKGANGGGEQLSLVG